MKAKITWSILLLMAIGLAGSPKNFCGKKCRHNFASAPGTSGMPEAVTNTEEESGSSAMGISPIRLFIFQLN